MATFIRGQKSKLADINCQAVFTAELTLNPQGLDVDIGCFGLDKDNKLSDERYFIFYNQPSSPENAIDLELTNACARFTINLNLLPAGIEKLVFTATVDNGSMGRLGDSQLRLGDGMFAFNGSDFSDEKAIIIAEIYRREGVWRFGAVGQGFNEGLAALIRHFGGAVAEATPAPAPAISLLKKVEQAAPHLVDLVKHATVSLEKVGLGSHQAKVCLVLDISGSMHSLYKNGLVQNFAERILALGCKFDDDQSIDIFLFGARVHQPTPMGLDNNIGYINKVIAAHPLEGDTCYGLAMAAVRKFYFPDSQGLARTAPSKAAMPVYVMFVTDGTTSDKPLTEKQLRWSSNEAIFWQFMGIGKGKKPRKPVANASDSDFPFLEKLDELSGRLIDNANYFSVKSPDEVSDAQLYDLLMQEYPDWLNKARQAGVLS